MAVQILYEIKGAEKAAADIASVASRLGIGIESVLDSAADKAETMMRANAPSFTGQLKESIDVFRKDKGERWIGPTEKGSSDRYPPSHYAKYVEEGGGPTTTLPNVSDIALRLGLSEPEAWAFAKYLRNSGKSVRVPSFFIERTADALDDILYGLGLNFVRTTVN